MIRGQGGKETETEYFAALVSSAFPFCSLKSSLKWRIIVATVSESLKCVCLNR